MCILLVNELNSVLLWLTQAIAGNLLALITTLEISKDSLLAKKDSLPHPDNSLYKIELI